MIHRRVSGQMFSISPNRDESRNRSPRAADREPEVRSRESRNERPIRDSGGAPPRICAQDNPNDRRHPNASFTCATCEREFCQLCKGDDRDCWNCQLLKTKCWACRKNAQEISDCEKNICNAHTFLGHDCLERCSRCHAGHERAGRGAPPPPPGGGGLRDHRVTVEGMRWSFLRPPPEPVFIWWRTRTPWMVAQLEAAGRLPGHLPGGGGAPTFSGTAVDFHGGAGSNQCGSSFYGPAYGGGVNHQGVGVGVSQPNVAAGYPSSVGSGSNLGPGRSLGYSIHGAGRQGDGGLLPEALRGDDGRDKCTKCSRIPEFAFPLVPCVGCGMRACEVCCPLPARLCERCRITSCTPIGALISTVVDSKDRYHHKCNTVLPAEPTADKHREWISEVKERVRNAFSFDSDYALAWISETDRLDYDALGGPCKYPVLDSNFTSAIRDCIKTRAVRHKMNRLTEAAQNMTPPQGIKGRQILKLLLNHLQTGVEDDQTFLLAELTSLKCRQTGHSDDEARLRSYLSTWDNLIYGIKRKIDDGVLLAVFIENVRHLRCMERDETVRSFAWPYKACQDCVERWQKRQNTLQMYQTFHEQRSRSGSHSRERDGVVRRYDPLARKSDPSPSRFVRCGKDGKPRSSSPGRSSQRDRASPGRGSQRDRRTPSPKSPRRQSPAGPADRSCWEYAKTGKCQHGRDCRFEHNKSPRNPAAPSTPRTGDRPVRDKPMYFGYCYDWMYGKCTAHPKADCVVVACPVMWAATPAIGGSTPGCLPPAVSNWEKSESGWCVVLLGRKAEVSGGTRSFGEGLLMPMGVIEDIPVIVDQSYSGPTSRQYFGTVMSRGLHCPEKASTFSMVPIGSL